MAKVMIDVPESLLRYTKSVEGGLAYKFMLHDIFMGFFESERFRKVGDPESFTAVYDEFSQIIDDCILAQQEGGVDRG